MPRPRRNNLPAPFSPISSLTSNIGPPPSPRSSISPVLSDFSTASADWIDGTNGFTAVNQFTTPVNFARGTNWSVVPPPLGSQQNVKAAGSANSSVTFLTQLKQEVPWSGAIPPLKLMGMSILLPGLPPRIWIQKFPQELLQVKVG
ncbi:hypothetical protein BY996DRAFT_6417048 [Phakopsora pachyrhizi]|nr:hypothetical protein BY996DRAFT_6417048 [Phakopsora pachyrhizi]